MHHWHIAPLSGSHNNYSQVSHLCLSILHASEGFMAQSVDESEFLALAAHLEGSNLLGDSSCLAISNVAGAQMIDQSGFAMVNVAHDSDYR